MSGSVAAVIPARFGSTRLPAKPLLRETGKTLIQHVWERVVRARRLAAVVVATDDARIAEAVAAFGGRAVMTSPDHASGTDRVAEVARALPADAYLNVQGDEPEVHPDDLDRLADAILEPGAQMATLAVPIDDPEVYANPHAVKVVVAASGDALYFSRASIPWAQDPAAALAAGVVRKHLGVYAFTAAMLQRFTSLPKSPLEGLERLEQLRALAHGVAIRVLDTPHDSTGIDTEQDYRSFVARAKKRAGGTA